MREALHSGDPSFRKAYLRLFVDLVIVGDAEIRLRGPTTALAKAATTTPHLPGQMVPGFVREWRPLGEGVSW